MKEIRIIVSNDSALPLLYKEGWELKWISEWKMYLDRLKTKTRQQKKAEQTSQYLQFKELYHKKSWITSQNVINKIDEIVKAWEFEKLMEGVEMYNKKIFLENIVMKFVLNPETYLNNRRWEDPLDIRENMLPVSEQWILPYLNSLSPENGKTLMRMKWEYKKELTKGVIENMIKKIKWVDI